MAKARFFAEGDSIDYTPGSAVTAGDIVVQGGVVGIAKVDIAASALGALAVKGIYDIEKVELAITVGDALYYDSDGSPYNGTASSGCVTNVQAAGNPFIGYATETVASTAERVQVLFDPTNAEVGHSLANVIADPGDAAAIPVTKSGTVSLVSAGAETRTLAAPSYPGQQINFLFKTDGGDCVITASAGVNQTGNNTLTFADAGDQLLLIGIESGANLVWRVVSNDGVGLTTV